MLCLYVFFVLVFLYIVVVFSYPEYKKTSDNTFTNIPCTINTCDRLLPEAELCRSRTRDVGFTQIFLSNGDQDPRIDKDKVYKKNRSFLSTCINMVDNGTPFMLMLEEDTTFDKSRLGLLKSIFDWALANPSQWDLVYGGGISSNPTFPTWRNANRLHCWGGVLGGHCMLVPLHIAKAYVMDTENRKASFDQWLNQQYSYRSAILTPAAAYQKNNPGATPSFLPGTHKFHQDITLILWPIILIACVLLVLKGLLIAKKQELRK